MKSFSQFLQESYLEERDMKRRRPGGPSEEEVKAKINASEAEKAAREAARKPSGAAARPDLRFKPQGRTTTVASSAIRPGDSDRVEAEKVAQQARERQSIPGAADRAEAEKVAQQARQRASSSSTPPAPTSTSPAGKPPAGPKIKVPAGAGKALKFAGKALGPAAAALDVAGERSKGSGWARSLAKGAVTAAGGALGGVAGSVAGPVGTIGGATAGSIAASKAFDTVAGANAVQRKAMATANRRSQSGGALSGIGGKTTFDTKKGTMTTGAGSQQRTVKLGKTSVVTDPKTGKQDVGYLAYKGGKAVYKRADTKNLAQTSSNPLERIGRSLFAGAYKQSDAAAAAKKLATVRQSDVARQKALNVKMKPGG